jgi:hypothetical protein
MTTVNQLDRKAREQDPLPQLEKRCIWFYKINGRDLDPNTKKKLKEQEEKYFALGENSTLT